MNRRPRVLLVIQNDGYPSDTRVEKEATTLLARGYGVSVICPRFGAERGHENVAGVHVYRFPLHASTGGALGYFGEYLYSLLAILVLSVFVLVRRGFDVVHAQNPPDLLFIVGLCFRPFGKKFVYDQNDVAPELYLSRFDGRVGSKLHRALSFFEGLSFRFADAAIVANDTYAQLAVERRGVPESKLFVVRNSVDLVRLKSLHLNGKDPAGERGTLLGYIGYLGPQDGVDHLLRSMQDLTSRRGRSDFRCLIIGDGEELEPLKALARELGVDGCVSFAGRLPWPEAMKLLHTADVCVDPDPSTPFNDVSTMVKMLEYMALGKPIVAYGLPEHRRLAQGAALYARPDDVTDLADKVVQLADDPTLMTRLGQTGRARVEEELNWDRSAANLMQAYERLLANLGGAQ